MLDKKRPKDTDVKRRQDWWKNLDLLMLHVKKNRKGSVTDLLKLQELRLNTLPTNIGKLKRLRRPPVLQRKLDWLRNLV